MFLIFASMVADWPWLEAMVVDWHWLEAMVVDWHWLEAMAPERLWGLGACAPLRRPNK
jgi:hypothetical protein